MFFKKIAECFQLVFSRFRQSPLSLIFSVCFIGLFSVIGNAQGEPGEGMGAYGSEYSFHIGNLLPNQVPGMTEITPQGGVRYGFAIGGGFVEIGFMSGKGDGAEWSDTSLSLRGDMPIENLLATVYLGIDLIRYQGVGSEFRSFGEGHLGGGIIASVSDLVWFRTDMKFNATPGTSLYVGVGFMFRIPDGGAGAGN